MNLTSDTFLNGRIRVKQHKDGYRFSIDAVILASHIMPGSGDVLIDLGTGCGIIPLILARCYPGIRIYGIEIQKQLADLAILNVRENQMEDRITILQQDMKTLRKLMIQEAVNWVVCNPPYRKTGSGRINPNSERAIARHEIRATLSDVIETARGMLPLSGKFITIYPAERITDLLTRMRSSDIEPKFARMIHSEAGREAKLILIQGGRGGRPGMKIGPPLFIYNKDGSYTDEVREMVSMKK